MNLKDHVAISTGSADDGVWVPWDEEGTCRFKIAYLGREGIKKARKKALVKEINRKTHRIEESIDEDILDREFMYNSVVGWQGLKAKHLKEILDPTRTVINIGDPEQEIPYTPDNKDIVLGCYNLTFSQFVSGVSLEIDLYQKYKEEDLRKNSPSSQSGTEAEISPAGSA